MTGDRFKREWSPPPIDLIKIDVEGAEPQVLKGMSKILESDRPVIFLEVLPGGAAAAELMTHTLLTRDYVFFRLQRDGRAEREEKLTPAQAFSGEVPPPLNHIACPIERIPAWLDVGAARRAGAG